MSAIYDSEYFPFLMNERVSVSDSCQEIISYAFWISCAFSKHTFFHYLSVLHLKPKTKKHLTSQDTDSLHHVKTKENIITVK